MDTPLQHSNGLVDETHRQLTQQILRALKEIRYGSVEIIIHDSKVVQIERKEKIRIDTDFQGPLKKKGEYDHTVLLSELKENTVPSRQLEASRSHFNHSIHSVTDRTTGSSMRKRKVTHETSPVRYHHHDIHRLGFRAHPQGMGGGRRPASKKDGRWEYVPSEDPGLKYLFLKGIITQDEYDKGLKVLETKERILKPNFNIDVNNGLNIRVGSKFLLKMRLLTQVRYSYSTFNKAWGTVGDSRNQEILGGQVEFRAFKRQSDSSQFTVPRPASNSWGTPSIPTYATTCLCDGSGAI